MRAHRVFYIALALGVFLAPVAPDDPLKGTIYTGTALQAMDTALHALNLSRADLHYEKKNAPTTMRLAVADQVLDDPLSGAVIADPYARQIKDSTASGDIRIAAGWLTPDIPLPATSSSAHPVGMDGGKPTLARIVDDLTLAEDHARATLDSAFADLTPTEKEELFYAAPLFLFDEESAPLDFYAKNPNYPKISTRDALKLAAKVRIDRITAATYNLTLAVEQAVETLKMMDFSKTPANLHAPDIEGGLVAYTDTPYGAVAIGGPGKNVYHGKCRLVIDLGGDDEYYGRPADGFGDETAMSVLIDLAGNDTYRGDDISNGGGYFGIGILYDLQGNDTFRGRRVSEGAGYFGGGVLIDQEGDDFFEADVFTQGAGGFGVGVLRNSAGEDTYRAAMYAQAFGFTRGAGILADASGNDSYYAGGKILHEPLYTDVYRSLSQGFAIGMRDYEVGGGVGFLWDGAGNDTYYGQVYCQGVSYWYSLGVLVDDSGNDAYNCYIYGQGSGIHLSSGVLIDRAGNDGYFESDGVGQGGGHDWGVGLLLDLAGNDYYSGAGLTQGAGNANAFGLLIDYGGNDSYAASKDLVQAWGNPARDSPSIGILLDLGGKDHYTTQGKDNSIWTGTKIGAGVDINSEPPKK